MRKAIGIVRVSQVAGREGESFVSPAEQRARLDRDDLELVAVHEELDVSGGTPLERREGLRAAVEAIEAGEAEVLVVAYFDRLVRSLRVQGEVVQRVEAAGGRVLAIDIGEVSERTAAQWLSGTMLGAVAEYHRRSTGERTREAQARAVARGVAPYNNVPPGYIRDEDRRFVPGPDAPVIREVFELRAAGATIKDCRAFLASRGIERSFHGVESMFSLRVYRGELRFGDLFNAEAHEPIISAELFDAVQPGKRGPRASSDRLLARLGVLRCGSCGARMSVGFRTADEGRTRYDFYRCPPVGDCTRRVTIGAEKVEDAIVDRLQVVLADAEGRASAVEGAREAEAAAERAQADLDAAFRAFVGYEDEPAARERLAELRAVRDEAVERAHRLGGLRHALRLTMADVDRLTIAELRELIRATFAAVTVAPGRGRDRLTFLLAEDAAGGG